MYSESRKLWERVLENCPLDIFCPLVFGDPCSEEDGEYVVRTFRVKISVEAEPNPTDYIWWENTFGPGAEPEREHAGKMEAADAE